MTGGVPVITLDGPGGSGKGTIARRLADRLGWCLLDSGAIYRILALASERAGVAADDAEALIRIADTMRVEFRVGEDGEPRILLDGDDITRTIRSEACGDRASRLAALMPVRQALLQRQRDFRRPPGLVADGRDMGTVVFPDAPVKIFLTASVEERARRRYKQLKGQGLGGNLSNLLEEIEARDRRDASRPISPLVPAPDAVIVDTTGLTVDEVLQRVMSQVRDRLGCE